MDLSSLRLERMARPAVAPRAEDPDPGNSRALQPELPDVAEVSSLQFSHDGRLIFSSGADRVVRSWCVDDGTLRREYSAWFRGHRSYISTVSLSPDGHTLVTAGGDRSVKLWDVASGRLLATYSNCHHGRSNPSRDAVFVPGSLPTGPRWRAAVPTPKLGSGIIGRNLRRGFSVLFPPAGFESESDSPVLISRQMLRYWQRR